MSDLVVYDSAASPAAGGTVVTTSALTAGRYRATVTTQTSGTVTAADFNNVQLMSGTGTVATLVQIPTANSPWTNPALEVTVAAPGAAVLVTAIGSASTSAVYNAQLVVTTLALYE